MELKTKHRILSPIQHELEVEAPWAEVEKRIPDVVREFGASASIDGFRKGKAPHQVVRARVGEERILKRAAELVAGEAFSEAAQTLEKKPLAPPELDIGEVTPGG